MENENFSVLNDLQLSLHSDYFRSMKTKRGRELVSRESERETGKIMLGNITDGAHNPSIPHLNVSLRNYLANRQFHSKKINN